MRWALPLLFALALLVGCGGGDGDVDKSVLLDHLEEGWEADGVPQPLTDCLLRQIDTSLTNAKVEEAYDSLPDGASGAEFAEAIGLRPFAQSGVVCGKRLLQSGDFTPSEVKKGFDLLASP